MKVVGLFKVGETKHLRQFREEGLLYCNSLEYFRSIEADTSRRDKRDGISASYRAEDITLIIGNGPSAKTITTRNGLRGRVDIHLGQADPNVFCMYALTNARYPEKIDPKVFELGQSVAIIKDGDKFRERLVAAARSEDLAVEAGLVEYVDARTYSGALGPFKKLSSYSFQSEYRIAFSPGLVGPRVLRIGSLRDIVQVSPVEGLNESLEYELRGDDAA